MRARHWLHKSEVSQEERVMSWIRELLLAVAASDSERDCREVAAVLVGVCVG